MVISGLYKTKWTMKFIHRYYIDALFNYVKFYRATLSTLPFKCYKLII